MQVATGLQKARPPEVHGVIVGLVGEAETEPGDILGEGRLADRIAAAVLGLHVSVEGLQIEDRTLLVRHRRIRAVDYFHKRLEAAIFSRQQRQAVD